MGNYEKVTRQKDDWHHKVMMSVARKGNLADLAQQKRKEDAIRDRENGRAIKLSAVCVASIRGRMMEIAMVKGRKQREILAKQTNAANTIMKFYRANFVFLNFRRHQRARAALQRQFTWFLPRWRAHRNMSIAKKVVAFCLSFSGAGGTVAAIKARRHKMVYIQRQIRKYLAWKRKVVYAWQAEYSDLHQKLL